MQDPWTLYWQSDRLDSCVATKSSEDAAAVEAFWTGVAAELTPEARVLDLATGNGTVPATLLQANPHLNVTGVDKAKIDPVRFLSSPGPLTDVDFLGEVDICSLPFDDEVFDAVTSQFGIEYAPLQSAVTEAVRVARHGGRLLLLMHHADSEIVRPARQRQREMDALLEEGGVLQTLKAYIGGQIEEAQLDLAGRAHLASDAGRSKQITGQIFEGVNRVINSVQSDNLPAGAELCDTMLLRLGADRDRLQMLADAALSQDEFADVIEQLRAAGVTADSACTLVANEGTDDEFIVGWQYCGSKD